MSTNDDRQNNSNTCSNNGNRNGIIVITLILIVIMVIIVVIVITIVYLGKIEIICFIPIVCHASRLESVDFIGQRKGFACRQTQKKWNFGWLCNPLSTFSSIHIQELKLLEGVLG